MKCNYLDGLFGIADCNCVVCYVADIDDWKEMDWTYLWAFETGTASFV